MKSKNINIVKWTTLWAYEHLSYKELPLFDTLGDLENSSNKFQLGYQPIKIRIIVRRLK